MTAIGTHVVDDDEDHGELVRLYCVVQDCFCDAQRGPVSTFYRDVAAVSFSFAVAVVDVRCEKSMHASLPSTWTVENCRLDMCSYYCLRNGWRSLK